MLKLIASIAVFVGIIGVICRSADLNVETTIQEAEGGDPLAQFRLAGWYYVGKGVPQSYTDAKKWFERVAQSDTEWAALAQHSLGRMYELGRGVPMDLQRALDYYKQSAVDGFAPAQYLLGVAYEFGNGVSQDLTLANTWFRKAVESGDGAAMARLGINIATGRGTTKDLTEAYVWLALAMRFMPRQPSEDLAVLRPAVVEMLSDVTKRLTAAQIQDARKQLNDWLRQYNVKLRKAQRP